MTSKANAQLGAMILSLVEQPGLRLAGAEEAARLWTPKIASELQLAEREAAAWEDEANARITAIYSRFLSGRDGAPESSSKSWTGVSASRALSEWATTRVNGLIARACASVYQSLLGAIPDHVRELNYVRAQMESFIKRLDELAPSESPRDGVCVPIFPEGAATATDSVQNVLRNVGPEDMKEFENALQGRIRHECRGIVEVCNRPKDLLERFLALVREHAELFLDSRAPRAKSVQVLAENATSNDDLESRVAELVAEAAPEVPPKTAISLTVLGLPEGGDAIAHLVRDICRSGVVKVTNSPDDVVIWRECRGMTLKSFPHLSAEAAGFREDDGSSPSPYSRKDIHWTVDW